VAFLEKRGYRLLQRNYLGRHGEIDVVAEKGGVLCFVEIRSRGGVGAGMFGGPAASVGNEKQRRIVRTAREWLIRNRAEGRACRFDVLGVHVPLVSAGEPQPEPLFELFENAFEATDL
jgi:putative endonuclease